jgi:PAS domain S-box-containing protein
MNAKFSDNFLHALFDEARENSVVLMDKNGIILEVNHAFEKCFAYRQKDVIGKSGAIFFLEEDLMKGLFDRELKNVMSKGQSSDNNYLLNGDRSVTWVSGESLLVKHKEGEPVIMKVIQNIHKQKVSENALRQMNEFNENILSSIEDVVIVMNKKLDILKANHAFGKLFNYHNKPEMKNFAEVIKPFDPHAYLVSSIEEAIEYNRDFYNKHIAINTAEKESKTFEVQCKMMKNSVDEHVLLILHDITVHKQVERQREDIIGFVAHELRNPLSNLMLCNEIMNESLQNQKLDEIREMLDRSTNNVMRLNRMIAGLYDATRVNSGIMELEISEFNFAEMVKEAIATVEVLQPTFDIRIEGDGNLMVTGDRYRLIQVLTNYLSNGIKYSNGWKEVILTINHKDQMLTVSVQDNGIGIPKDQLSYIFERFFRAEKTKDIEGIGLGLYLCRQIVHAHNGRVWVESEEGKGSVFYFCIPVKYKKPESRHSLAS